MRDLLRNAFGGDPAQALQCLLDSARLDDGELAAIKQVINDAAQKPRGKSS